jgi:hypothetical protein
VPKETVASLSLGIKGVPVMGQATPPKTVFNESDLAQLEWVLEAVFKAVDAHAADQDTKQSIRRRLFLLACNGMSEPEVLRDHLIESFTHAKDLSHAG